MTKNFDRIIRIANIIEESRFGGPQMRMCLIASTLNQSRKNKIETSFIFSKNESLEFRERCNMHGIKYLLFPFSKISRNWINILKYLILFPVDILILVKLLKKNSFDIVHVSGGSLQIKGVIAAKLSKIKVIWEMNDTYTPYIIRLIFFFISRLADSLIFASSRTKKYYESITPKNKKNFLIPSPVNINFYDPSHMLTIEEFIKKNIAKKKIIIGTVANVSPVKNLELFLNIAQKLLLYSNKIIFIVVGAVHNSQKKYYEYLLDSLKRKKLKNFFFLGPRNDIRPFLKAMDIYVCCSKNESSPLSLFEAMSMKKAIVSTNIGDVRNFINNNVNGFIVENDDAKLFAKYIKKLIKDPKLRYKLGESAREIVNRKFNLTVCSNKHLYMYRKVFDNYKYN